MAADDGYDRLMREITLNGAPRRGEDYSDDETPKEIGPCCARPSNKWLPTLHVKDGPRPVRTLPYSHFDHGEFAPTKFVVEFACLKTYRLTVTGTALWPCYDLICQGRLAWIAAADRQFRGEDGKPFIESVRVEEVREE